MIIMKLKLNQTVRPLKAKLEEAYRKISSLEEELKSEKLINLFLKTQQIVLLDY